MSGFGPAFGTTSGTGLALPAPHWNYNGAYNAGAIGGSIFDAFKAIGEANDNWRRARDYGLTSGDHWKLYIS